MEVWTIQMGKWRLAEEKGIELIDSTVKSGVDFLAPTWGMVKGIKSGTLSPEEYTKQYYALMRKSYKFHSRQWEELFAKEKIAIACYCGSEDFCHRKILMVIMGKIAAARKIPFVYKGELI